MVLLLWEIRKWEHRYVWYIALSSWTIKWGKNRIMNQSSLTRPYGPTSRTHLEINVNCQSVALWWYYSQLWQLFLQHTFWSMKFKVHWLSTYLSFLHKLETFSKLFIMIGWECVRLLIGKPYLPVVLNVKSFSSVRCSEGFKFSLCRKPGRKSINPCSKG